MADENLISGYQAYLEQNGDCIPPAGSAHHSESQIALGSPVLVEHCYQCHAAESKELQGGLRLDEKAGWQLGGESGRPAIVPGKPDESPLIRAIRPEQSLCGQVVGRCGDRVGDQ